MDKPIYVLYIYILELSKLHVYETYYDELQPKFRQEKLQLNYIDTDGRILKMKTENFFKDFKSLGDKFDFSNLGENHELFSETNKKIIGRFKIETPKNIWITEVVCLGSKMYAFENEDEKK